MQIKIKDAPKRGKMLMVSLEVVDHSTMKVVQGMFSKDDFDAVLSLMKASHRAGIYGETLNVLLIPATTGAAPETPAE